MIKVVKPFATVNRKFKAGDVVTEADFHSLESLKAKKDRGFIKDEAAPAVRAQKAAKAS